MRFLCGVLLIAALTRPSHAGDCTDAPALVGKYEAWAKKPSGSLMVLDELCLMEIGKDEKLKQRTLQACETIVAHDGKNRACVVAGIWFGAKKLGGRDLIDVFMAAYPKLDPIGDTYTIALL